MGRVPPAVAAIRVAVRGALADLPEGSVVLVACSGGADSLALAAGLAFVAPRHGWRGGAVVVDHGWTADSAQRSASVCATCRGLGLSPVEGLTARAPRREGPARDARRQALMQAAVRLGAAAVLLGHTLDDQAETVLLRLARGAGARSLAGMAARSGLFRRPLLGLSRSLTREACRVSGLSAWADPANADPAFARARVRHDALPALVAALGTGVPLGLARSADLLRLDNQALDELAEQALRECGGRPGPASGPAGGVGAGDPPPSAPAGRDRHGGARRCAVGSPPACRRRTRQPVARAGPGQFAGRLGGLPPGWQDSARASTRPAGPRMTAAPAPRPTQDQPPRHPQDGPARGPTPGRHARAGRLPP